VVPEPATVDPGDSVDDTDVDEETMVVADPLVVFELESPPESRVASTIPPTAAARTTTAAIGPHRRSCRLRSAPVELAGCI
jgi:hypothetical protein